MFLSAKNEAELLFCISGFYKLEESYLLLLKQKQKKSLYRDFLYL